MDKEDRAIADEYGPESSRVFVPQVPSLRVPGGWKPKYDLRPAKKFGEVVVILEPGNAEPYTIQGATDLIATSFSDHRLTCADYLLPIGDPVLIAAATAVMAEVTGGRVRLLRWDARAREYVFIEFVTRGYEGSLEEGAAAP